MYVNLSWSDPWNELSRMKDQQELSPEISEKERMTSVFTCRAEDGASVGNDRQAEVGSA